MAKTDYTSITVKHDTRHTITLILQEIGYPLESPNDIIDFCLMYTGKHLESAAKEMLPYFDELREKEQLEKAAKKKKKTARK